ncbi:nif3-like protein 1 [Plakobranchus ocellatus]|uniref:NIF3-like protein 1 n=1 Tax=Plakobranchus ocellatus TaxID=259542 RepID=A0AAV4BH72_9GAST|nr:nif3-like protein 1 [Plakobranchus ocellatus]
MNSLETVVAKLKKLAPLHLAGSWDNVGLLVEPSAPKYVSKVMLTIDLTTQVMEEAKDRTVDLIISYHPPIFVPLKRLTQRSWKERIVVDCMENRIAVFSPHTSYDALEGGVNDWLLSAFDVNKNSVKPIEPSGEFPGGQSHLLEVNIVDAARIKEVRDQCLVSQLHPDSRLRRNKEAFTIHAVKSNVTTGGEEWRLQVPCDQEELTCMLKGLGMSGSPEKYHVSQLAQVPQLSTGMGRYAELKSPISVQQAVTRVKTHLGLEHVMLAQRQDQESKESEDEANITSVAVGAGSGGSILKAQAGKADLLLTGEMSHHEVLDAVHQGSHVILARHSNSERGYLKSLQSKLVTALGASVEVFISDADQDPLKVV